MIRINLLPPEYRRVDGTPVARLVATVACATLVTVAAGYWGWVHFGKLAEVRAERERQEEELANKKAQAERSQALLKEFNEYKRRRDTIEKVAAGRILWSKHVDELADTINNKGDTKRHLVWLGSIRSGGPRQPGSAATLAIRGWSGRDYSRLAEFNADLKKNEEVAWVDPPAGNQVTFNGDAIPNTGFEFTFTLDLKKPNWREHQ
jgi:Tfp pilus assembly protein PilN